MRTALGDVGLGVAWFIALVAAVELSTTLLTGTTISGFAFLTIRFAIYFVIALAGVVLVHRLRRSLKLPLLIAVLLLVAERLTFHYEIYRWTVFSVLNLTIDYIAFGAGVLVAWMILTRASKPAEVA